MVKRFAVLGALALVAACSQEAPPAPGSVPPAGAEDKAAFGENVTKKFLPATDAAVKELFCQNALGSPCPADIDEKLAPYFTGTENTRLDVADAFARMKAAENLGDPGALITDEAYVDACYEVVLGRAPDPSGLADALSFVKRTGERKILLRAMLQSAEFKG